MKLLDRPQLLKMTGVLTGLLAAGTAAAQGAEEAAPAPAEPAPAEAAPTDPAAAPAEAAPAEAPPLAAEPEPAPEPATTVAQTEDPMMAEPAAPPPTAPAPPPPAEPEAEEGEDSPLDLFMFADAYWSYNTNQVGGAQPWHRAYAQNNGFSLSFLGIDATYDGGDFGATGSLRFGPSVPIFYGGNTSSIGIENVLQAYVTWKPIEQLTLDFGQFGTIYGAEVAESWQNLNYTRGGLYYGMQPFWHTGLRVGADITDNFGLTGLLVNGANNVIDDNDTPSVGLQASVSAGDVFGLSAGWFGALQPSDDASGFHNFFDVVATVNVEDFSLVFNADFNIVDNNVSGTGNSEHFYGLSLAAGYAFTDWFGLAARGEYLVDDGGILYGTAPQDTSVTTITGTLDFHPIPDSQNFILRLDNRAELSNRDIFVDKDGDPDDFWYSIVLGAVVHTDG